MPIDNALVRPTPINDWFCCVYNTDFIIAPHRKTSLLAFCLIHFWWQFLHTFSLVWLAKRQITTGFIFKVKISGSLFLIFPLILYCETKINSWRLPHKEKTSLPPASLCKPVPELQCWILINHRAKSNIFLLVYQWDHTLLDTMPGQILAIMECSV